MTYTPTGEEIVLAYHNSRSWEMNLRWTNEPHPTIPDATSEFLDVGDSAVRIVCTMDLDYWQADLLEVRQEATDDRPYNRAWISVVTKHGRGEDGRYKFVWAWSDHKIIDLHDAVIWWANFVECEREDGGY